MARMSPAVYKDLLAIPHVGRFAIFGVIAQFPFSMLAMAMLIGVRDGYGSYTLAGIASAIMALSGGVIGPQIGKLVDIWGQKKVGLAAAAFWLVSHGCLALVLTLHPPVWVLYICAVMLGVTMPANAFIRARWTIALRREPEKMNSALSLTSILEECMWVIGTPLATMLATLISPLAALAFSVTAILIGGWGLLGDAHFEPPVKKRVPKPETERISKVPLFSGGFVSLLLVLIAYGAFQSTTGVAVVAFATELGQQEYAGFVSGCFSGAAMLSAIFYGMRTWTSPLWKRFYVGLTALALGCSALVFVDSMPLAALVMFLSGLFQAPTIVNINQMIMRMVPRARFTEGMAMFGSMWVIGLSTANLVAGAMIDRHGSAGGFGTVIGFAVLALAIALAGYTSIKRESLRDVPILEDDE